MNTRLARPPALHALYGHLSEWACYSKLIRYRPPEGVEVIAGRRNARSLRIAGKNPHVLCLHGYCGGPEEVAVAVQAAGELGLAASAPLLSGHGGDPAVLSKLRFDDWLQDARREFLQLRSGGKVVLVGLSLGSLLATQLALDHPESVGGLVVLANPFWVKRPVPGALLSLVDWCRIPDFGYPTREGADAQEGARRYHVQPVHGAVSVQRAGQRLRERLSDITAPVLVLHGSQDQVCSVSNAWKFAERVKSPSKRVVVVPGARHVLGMGSERSMVRDEIAGFLTAFC